MTGRQSLSEEERSEVERYATLYEGCPTASLRMDRRDWEKFDTPEVAKDSYAASVCKLRDVRNLRVLDAGCGDGWLTVILAKRGAQVAGVDVSAVGVRLARGRASANNVQSQCDFFTASIYSLPFQDRTFDAVIGQSILHHLSHKAEAARQLHRVMKPGAKAVFAEPFGNSLWLERLRLLVPVKSQAPENPTEWARQFKYSDLEPFAEYFDVTVEEYQLFSRIDRLVKWKRVLDTVARMDRTLLNAVAWLRPFARSIVIELQKT